MKYKTLLSILVIPILLIGSLFVFKNTNSSLKAETLTPNNPSSLIRVGISTNDFSALEYDQVNITSNSSFELTDKSSNALLAKSAGNGIFTIKVNNSNLSLYNSSNLIANNIAGPISIKTINGSPIHIVGLKRVGKPAYYRGEIEIVKSPTRNNKLSVVNILPLEEYLKGVVPNELPVRFGLEALKAQAVAARNYAIKPRTKTYSQFDICDSVECQVYFGSNTEAPLSNQAIEETKGLVALYEGDLVLALYSSTAGGYTENFENVFTEPGNTTFPTNPLPYLKGKPDVATVQALNTEEAAKQFYTTAPACFDNDSRYYRWTKKWSRQELESILNKSLVKYHSPTFVFPKLEENSTIGTLKNIEVIARGVSGKAMAIKIITNNGEWFVLKELFIRKVLNHSGRILPSANVVFNNIYDSQGNLIAIEATGGGLGHGVGMSQYGAGYMCKNGYTFDQILQHYYDGITIGTNPVILVSDNKPVTQTFYSPKQNADLIIYNPEKVKHFKIFINSHEINITKNELNQENIRINLDKYITKGINEIVYDPSEIQKGKNIKAWIEVFKSSAKLNNIAQSTRPLDNKSK